MHRSVQANWVRYNSPIEGVFFWMYPDKKKFITTGMGNLIDPVERALALAWKLPNGQIASKDQVAAEWHALKGRPELANYRASSQVVQSATTVRLHNDDVAAVVNARLLANESRMRKFLSGYDDYPADAQLGLLSLGWALGSDFELQYPKLTRAANAGDWLTCARECHIDETGNAGVIPRNIQNVLLFNNAAAVSALHTDPETLHWPAHAPTVADHIRLAADVAHSMAQHPVAPLKLITEPEELS